MALTDKLTAIADAIRAKGGTTAQLTPAQMPAAIAAIQTDPTLQDKSVTPTTSQQVVTASTGYDGLRQVTVGAIPSQYIVPTGSTTITENGTHNVSAFASAVVNVPTGGGGLSYADELYSSDAVSISYTSTSAGTAKTITGITGICTYPFIVVIIENTDTASGTYKFIRSATAIGNVSFASGAASVTRYGTEQYYNSAGALTNMSGTSYGIWGYSLSTSSGGTLTIRGRCNGSYYTSLTGTYRVRVLGVRF